MQDPLVQFLVEKCQSTSPYEICKQLGIAVQWARLPKRIRGVYRPSRNSHVIIVDSALSAAAQRFIVANHIHDFLAKSDLWFYAQERVEDIRVDSVFFAADLLSEHGEYANVAIDDFYIGEGASPDLARGLAHLWVKSGRDLIPKSTKVNRPHLTL